MDQNLALVIGINQYEHGIPQLSTAVNDATKITDILQSSHGYHVWTLLDEAATLDSIKAVFSQDLPQHVQVSDRLLIYFAGHGIALNGDDGPEGYLIPQDAVLGLVESYLPMTWLQDALNKLPCRHFLGVLDCCFAGAFRWSSTRDLAAVPDVIHQERYERFRRDPAWQIITSADYDQKALDAFSLNTTRGPQGNHSPFAQALISALSGEADVYPPAKAGQVQGDGLITATELYLYIRDQIESNQASSTQQQTPGLWPLKKHDKGEYLFFHPTHPLNLPPSPPLDEAQNPYRGLEAYDEAHHHLFFGRDALIEDLKSFVTGHPLTVVLGASGSGKSSLVKAGLIPALRQTLTSQNGEILPPIRPGESPQAALARLQINGIETNSTAQNTKVLSHTLEAWIKQYPQGLLFLVIDQFEELITLCQSPQERNAFLQQLAEILHQHPQQIRVIVTLRSDYEPHFQDSPLRSIWQRSRFIIPAMSRQALKEAIEEPASARVLYFEPTQIVDRLIDEVIQMPGGLPLLSFTLSELYLKYLNNVRSGVTDNRAITQADYEALGGVTRSLTQRADQEYQALVEEEEAYAMTIRRVMLRMVSVGTGEVARRRVLLSELGYDGVEQQRVQRVIQRLTDARLLVEGQDAKGNPYVEPAHDALVRGWQRLLEWQRTAEERLILQRRLTPAAQEWHDNQRNQFLWNSDPRLDLMKAILTAEKAWFNEVEGHFIQQSLRLKRRNVIARWSAAIAVILGLSGLAMIALVSQRNSLVEQATASKKSAEVSLLSRPAAMDSLVDSVAAAQTIRHPLLQLFPPKQPLQTQIQGSLISSLYQVKEKERISLGAQTLRSVWSPDGQTMAIASEDGTLNLWSAEGKKLAAWVADPMRLTRVAFSPDGQRLATVGDQSQVNLWDMSGQKLASIQASQNGLVSVVYSPNGQYIAAGTQDGNLNLWTQNGKRVKTWKVHSGMVKSVHFSPDSRFLVTAGDDELTRIWTLEGKQEISFKNHAWEVVFSPDGKSLASAGDDGTYSLWTIQGKRVGQWRGDSERLWAIAYRPDGEQVATAGEDGVVRLWKQGQIVRELQGHTGPGRTVRYTPDGQLILSSGDDGTARIWSTADRASSRIQLGNSQGVGLSADHRQIVTRGENTGIRFWSLAGELLQEQQIGQLNSKQIQRLQLSPQGGSIAIALQDGKIIFGQLQGNQARNSTYAIASQDGKIIPPASRTKSVQGHQGAIAALDFSADGQWLASVGTDGLAKLWTAQGEFLRLFKDSSGKLLDVAFSPVNQELITAGADGPVGLWSVEGKLLHRYPGHIGAVKTVAVHPQGNAIASGGEDGTVRLWSRSKRKPLSLFRAYGKEVTSVAFSPDGTLVASSDDEGGIQLWDWENKFRFAAWKGHTAAIAQVLFSRDGSSVITTDDQGELKVWNQDSLQALMRSGCEVLGDELKRC